MNWDDPAARAALIESVGAEEYNRRLKAHLDESTVATVNGRAIRPVNTQFGLLYAVQGTKFAFSTREAAENFAKTQPVLS